MTHKRQGRRQLPSFDDLLAESRGILQTDRQNLTTFSAKNGGP